MGDGEFSTLIARVWMANAAAMRQQLLAIDAAGVALLAGPLDADRRAAAINSAHKLRGSLGTFGRPEGSQLAGELEALLRASGDPPALRVAEIAELLNAVVTAGPSAPASAGPEVVDADWHALAPRPTERAATDTVDVVMVEDDEVLAALVVNALETRGYTATVITDGRIAVETLSGRSPLPCRLILLDVDLPGLDGLAVLRELTASGVTKTTPTIMLTVRATEREVVEALQTGALDHVAKPFSMPVLMERIRSALER